MQLNYIKSIYITLYYIILYYIILYYIIFYYILSYFIVHLFYYLFTIWLKVAMVRLSWKRSRLWQLDNSGRKVCERGWWGRWQHHSMIFFQLIYIFFEVMLMSRINGVTSCLSVCMRFCLSVGSPIITTEGFVFCRCTGLNAW